MVAQPIDCQSDDLVAYCAKCGKFYLAKYDGGQSVYLLSSVDKRNIRFVDCPYVMEDK
jgi:hypothetical protein